MGAGYESGAGGGGPGGGLHTWRVKTAAAASELASRLGGGVRVRVGGLECGVKAEEEGDSSNTHIQHIHPPAL
jgi:hypothetical protein